MHTKIPARCRHLGPTRHLLLGALGVGMLALSCGKVQLDAGSTGNDADAGALWPDPPNNSFDLPCNLPAPLFAAGTWRGELDSLALPSGSKAVRIEITGAYLQSDGLCGKIVFGEDAALPVATDPAAPPPGAPWPVVDARPETTPLEGFPYEFDAQGTTDIGFDAGSPSWTPAVQGHRLRFGITLLQFYKSWCNLQRAYVETTSSNASQNALTIPLSQVGCLPPSSIIAGPGPSCPGLGGVSVQNISCAQAVFCTIGRCACRVSSLHGLSGINREGCTVVPVGNTMLDLTVAGAAMSGNIVLAGGVEGMHLTLGP